MPVAEGVEMRISRFARTVYVNNKENVTNFKSEKSATKNLLNPIFSQPPIVDLTDSPPAPQRETTVTSSDGSGTGSGSPRAAGVASTASEVNYTDDAAPAARGQPLDLVQGGIAQWNVILGISSLILRDKMPQRVRFGKHISESSPTLLWQPYLALAARHRAAGLEHQWKCQ